MAWVVLDNIALGGDNKFGTTEGNNKAKFFSGTAPVGTLTLGSAVYASTTIMRKIIAANTDSAIET